MFYMHLSFILNLHVDMESNLVDSSLENGYKV